MFLSCITMLNTVFRSCFMGALLWNSLDTHTPTSALSHALTWLYIYSPIKRSAALIINILTLKGSFITPTTRRSCCLWSWVIVSIGSAFMLTAPLSAGCLTADIKKELWHCVDSIQQGLAKEWLNLYYLREREPLCVCWVSDLHPHLWIGSLIGPLTFLRFFAGWGKPTANSPPAKDTINKCCSHLDKIRQNKKLNK